MKVKLPQWAVLVIALVVGILIQVAIQLELLNAYLALILTYMCIMIVSSLGLSIIYGFTGQFSLGHAAFMGLGAYAGAVFTHYVGSGDGVVAPWAFLLALIVGGVFAALVGYLAGLPILRLSSDYLGIATLGLGIIVRVTLENSDKIIPITAGARGMTGIDAPPLIFLWAFAILLLAVIVARNLRFSSVGRACFSIREDETAANLMGIDVVRYKTIAFVLGCFYAGVAGVLYAHTYVFLHPMSFDFLKSFDPLLIVVLGGLGSLSGTVLAGAGWVAVLEGLRMLLSGDLARFLEWRYVIYPVVLIIMMLLRPQGIFGTREFAFLTPREVEAPEPALADGVVTDGAHS
ncbi:MAG TPA: branched-chain amino acid ABC transporter permease [Anaerolineae bacterium]|nr:branched-chain amino acid ABC transporter permease [Anaerolineae bacterium]HOQ99244.1 branched-chain amino acid ABC transporter permease [Anaerolineae bacterium]HPL30597.1 branched-chain amino acid ABC transporter permease [Anaerolineae bacterium]